MTSDINTLNEFVIDIVERYVDCVRNELTEEINEDNIQELASHILFFNRAGESYRARERVFENYMRMIDSSSEQLDEASTIKDFTDEVNSIENPLSDPNKCDRYVQFLQKFPNSSSADKDDEIVAVSQTINLRDPITKKLLVEPVKNKKCGHIYEKSTILQFISKNHKTKCPIAGCNAADYVRKSDLVVDNSLKNLLKNVNK